MRRVLGFIAAIASVPLAVSIAGAILAMAGIGSATNSDWRSWTGTAVIFSIYAVPIALAVGVVVGLPAALIMESAGITGPRAFATLGCLTGVAPFVVFTLIVLTLRSQQFTGWTEAAAFAALGAWCGVCAALVYWRLAVRGRVDRR